jgi:hypothetical protein
MEVAKLVPEEEETRERVSSMDVLRILKQRGDKDKWARDVVRGGAQNLAHSLCARVIKTFNAKLKHEGEKHCLDVGRVAQILVCEVAYSSRQLRLDLRRFVLVFVSRALKMRMNNSIKGNGFVKWTECAHYYVLRVKTVLQECIFSSTIAHRYIYPSLATKKYRIPRKRERLNETCS